ncbi:MAG: UvrB/UvrC motif-containing protein [Clostridia bacterium]|nr:UvrB/UvrC motif-containing protein [Clostridia bacterium]
MMCDECGVRPATIHLTTFTGGEKQDKNLCATCLTKYKMNLPTMDLSNLAGILGGFIEKALSGKKEEVDSGFNATCETCSMDYKQFKRNGMLGCADCYKAFREPIEEMLTRMHGNAQHVGRIPGGVNSQISLKLQIDKLKQQLTRAVSQEEYEKAALLRDQIRALQNELKAKTEVVEGAQND